MNIQIKYYLMIKLFIRKNLSKQNLNSNQLMLKGIIEDIKTLIIILSLRKDLSSIAKLDKNNYFELKMF